MHIVYKSESAQSTLFAEENQQVVKGVSPNINVAVLERDKNSGKKYTGLVSLLIVSLFGLGVTVEKAGNWISSYKSILNTTDLVLFQKDTAKSEYKITTNCLKLDTVLYNNNYK